jgi:hypothetical protein
MIGPSGLLLVVSHLFAVMVWVFLWVGGVEKYRERLNLDVRNIFLPPGPYSMPGKCRKRTVFKKRINTPGSHRLSLSLCISRPTYCWQIRLANYNDWSKWFAISSLAPICSHGLSFFMGGGGWKIQGKTQLGCEKYFFATRVMHRLYLHLQTDSLLAPSFWLVNHNDWSKWFVISSLPPIWSPGFGFMRGGVDPKKGKN